jgi:hypothetical protein
VRGSQREWEYVQNNFPDYPYEGDLEEEYGIYPPLGEAGPVALVSGEDNACLIAAAPKLLEACEMFVAGYDNDDVTLVQYMGRLPALIANARAAIAATKGEPVCTGRRQARPV